MRIVKREEFLKLPSGTVYATHYNDDGFGTLCIKRSSSPNNDWYYTDLNDFDDCDNSDDRYKKMKLMREEGASYPLRLDTQSRDGLFEEDEFFAIYERGDIQNIITKLTECL